MVDEGTASSKDAQEDSRMMDFLKGALKELEDAQGAPDEEAQQALRALQQQMSKLQHMQRSVSEKSLSSQPASSGTAPSDIEIASSIDRLDEQLAALEGKLGEADGHVQHLLGHSTALWLGDGSAAPGQEHPSAQNGSNELVEHPNAEKQPEQSGKQGGASF